jgi:two-component system LytT family response regulator
MITALLVDDEPPARRRLRTLLSAYPDVDVSGEATTVPEALTRCIEHRPDLVFLDVGLAGADGFELIDLLGAAEAPAVVFVTAHAEHAVRAWEADAVDYLLKPFDHRRLGTTMARVRRHLRRPPTGAPAGAGEPGPPLRRIPVEVGGRVRFVDVRAIEYLRADRNYVQVHTAQRSYLVRSTLQAMQDRLDDTRFVRVHRSVVVRTDRVDEVRSLPHGELSLHLTGGERIICSRTHAAAVRAALGL